MNIFQEYMTYIKDNPEHYWFKRKLYGWGWTPATWEGWITLVVYMTVISLSGFIVGIFVTDQSDSSFATALMIFFIITIITTIILIYICFKKGEKPRWQWGSPNKK